MPAPSLQLHPDRLLPAEPATRAVARRLYEAVRDLPIVSPHGHIDASVIDDDAPFRDPVDLLVTPDHYVTRLLHAGGTALEDLGVGREGMSETDARRAWRTVCEQWALLAGTPVRLWLETTLVEVFGVTTCPGAGTADEIYDQVAGRLADAAFRPRALYRRFGIRVLATTDDACSELGAHAALAADRTWDGRIVPTFRPDRYLEPEREAWPADMKRLAAASDVDTGDYRGYLAALEARRHCFVEHGATATDHGHADAGTQPLDDAEAARIYLAALHGGITAGEAVAFRRHMVHEMARMSCDDGLVMMLHPGIRRDHHQPTAARFGTDVGADIPVRLGLTDALRPLLDRFGTAAGFHLVVFTADESVWSRELAPMAGFYPAVFVGAPWWFLDAPAAIVRFQEAVTETAGFSRLAGFVDDTRAFCSIPARHDMARRLDAAHVARLVAVHRLEEDEARDIVVGLVGRPIEVFKL